MLTCGDCGPVWALGSGKITNQSHGVCLSDLIGRVLSANRHNGVKAQVTDRSCQKF